VSGELLVSCTAAERAAPYLEALAAVGADLDAVRVLTPATTTPAEAGPLAAGAAGLLLCGGPDVEPHHYGEQPHPNANVESLPPRDALELALLAGAQEARTPLLGVCRGLQMVNVFLGGSLWQDLKLQWPNAVLHDLSFPRDALIHPVHVTGEGGELAEVLAAEAGTPVNSRHHQAIKQIAADLAPVALAPDGIVEAVAGRDPRWWLWAVQWHPENLVSLPAQRALFARFREQAAARALVLDAGRQPALR
jgi:putative glutamine amidotransferase